MTISLTRNVPYGKADFEAGINDVKLNEYWMIDTLKKDPYDEDFFRLKFKYIPTNKISYSIRFEIDKDKDVNVYMAKDGEHVKSMESDENIGGFFRIIESMTKDPHLLFHAFKLKTCPMTAENIAKRATREFALAFNRVKR